MENKIHPSQEDMKAFLHDEERNILKIAVAQMKIHVFVYDVVLRKVYFFSSHTLPFGVLNETEYTIEDMINHSRIDADYISLFRTLFEDIENGKSNSEALIKLNDIDSKTVWHHLMLTNYYNHDGNPIRAIGTIQDVSNRVETELRYIKEKQYRLAMMADSRRVYEINVTKDRFIKLESIQDTTDFGNWDVYTNAMTALRLNNVYRKDWEAFEKVAKRENLIDGFQRGVTEFYCEYRIVDAEGSTSWSSSSTHLLKDPLSDDIKGFIYVKDIDRQKTLELELYRQAEHDPLTGIFNRRSAEKSIKQILSESDKNKLHGFLIIDFDNFKLVNDNFGHAKGDYLLKQMAQLVKELVGNKGIFARLGGDEFLVFLKDAGSVEQITSIAESICDCVRNIRIEEGSSFFSSVSIGISTYPSNGTTFEELYENSDSALYHVKMNGKDHISVFGNFVF